MRSQFDGLLETRVSESGRGWSTPKLICCECGKSAEGAVSCDDGPLCYRCANLCSTCEEELGGNGRCINPGCLAYHRG
jgi:hypothetical protein